MWRSLNHHFVLPFLGIYETELASQFFLVSPYMKNGTLAQWRKKANRSTADIEKLVGVSFFGYLFYSFSYVQDIGSCGRD